MLQGFCEPALLVRGGGGLRVRCSLGPAPRNAAATKESQVPYPINHLHTYVHLALFVSGAFPFGLKIIPSRPPPKIFIFPTGAQLVISLFQIYPYFRGYI